MGGQLSGEQLPRRELVRGNCPGDKSLRGNCPGGNFMGGNCPGGNCPGGNVRIPFNTPSRSSKKFNQLFFLIG